MVTKNRNFYFIAEQRGKELFLFQPDFDKIFHGISQSDTVLAHETACIIIMCAASS